MTSFIVENVDEALPLLLQSVQEGTKRKTESRNGPVKSFNGPVSVTYQRPWERFVMHPLRRNNVAFLVMEGLWMLSGRDDVEWLARFNEQMRVYSDNGTTFHGAYGHRLREGRVDQLTECAAMLEADPTTRRAVAQIWDQERDLCSDSKDIPCNDMIMFRVIGKDVLDMTVCNRSNDLVWGMCGANAAHFSMIHEYVAAKAGMVQGRYTQFSNNLHLYLDTPRLDILNLIPLTNDTWYYARDVKESLVPLVRYIHQFDIELEMFMQFTTTNDRLTYTFEEPFFEHVAKPLFNYWVTRKYQKYRAATYLTDIAAIKDSSIRELARQWVSRDGEV